MQKRLIAIVLGAACLTGPALAQDKKVEGHPDEAHRNKTAMCIGCHGIPGYKTAYPEVYHVPKIAGQNYEYLVIALNEYKKGERAHPTMHAQGESLSDQDIRDIATYLSSIAP